MFLWFWILGKILMASCWLSWLLSPEEFFKCSFLLFLTDHLPVNVLPPGMILLVSGGQTSGLAHQHFEECFGRLINSLTDGTPVIYAPEHLLAVFGMTQQMQNCLMSVTDLSLWPDMAAKYCRRHIGPKVYGCLRGWGEVADSRVSQKMLFFNFRHPVHGEYLMKNSPWVEWLMLIR